MMAAPTISASSAGATSRQDPKLARERSQSQSTEQHKSKKRKLSPAGAPTQVTPSRDDQPISQSRPPRPAKQTRQPPPLRRQQQQPQPSKPYTLATATALPADDHEGQRALQALLDATTAGGHDVQIQSVISSSKMQKKVSAVLRHLQRPGASAEAAQQQQPQQQPTRIIVLRAKAADAGKLVSIVEIAKREIEKEHSTSGGGGGIWYQYITLGEELEQRERTQATATHNTLPGGGVRREEGEEGATKPIEETVFDKTNDPTTRDSDPEQAEEEGEREEDEQGDDDFEIMKTRFERAIEGRPLVRGTPIMSMILSRVPLGHEMRKRFGETTNAVSPSPSG